MQCSLFYGYATLFVGELKIKAYANKIHFVGDTLNFFTSHLYTLCVFIFNIQHMRSDFVDSITSSNSTEAMNLKIRLISGCLNSAYQKSSLARFLH